MEESLRDLSRVRLLGDRVTLRPMMREEISMFYSWATKSDVSCFWYGKMYGNEPPTLQKFLSSWGHYIDDSAPEKGRCWTIIVNDAPIGMVSWDEIDFKRKRTGLDIIIGSLRNCSKGYGPDALKTLARFLFEGVGLKEIFIGAHVRNVRAIKAYEKAGFRQVEITDEMRKDRCLEDYMQGFQNSVLLVKRIGGK